MLFDSHIHTEFSTDSKMWISEAIEKAEELNIGLILTEHMDINYPEKDSFIFSPEEYFKEYEKYKSNKLLLGIELGMQPNCVLEGKKIIEKYPFDYVLGSIHLVDGIDIYLENYYKGRSKKETFEMYFKFMLDCLNAYTFIDSLAHIDYISRYARYDDSELIYEDFYEYIDEILKTAVQKNIALEINTRRFESNKSIRNVQKIYKRFYELGGRIVTLGSDSHQKGQIGYKLDIAKDMADSCGLKAVYYKNRKPEYI
ncbi:histidinol phosphate phosphatase [Clostridium sp. SYSU_GA19001]|uniref:histidinol phosphate phosphatase n=1 Tax=Clostridium caldaquaticum TaxID=2940653 RepID=UPI0020776C29|nr:histidinol phosphate phosphatase [Clostridium caldaquaticum]MCM8709621.1 histidinol phosphate phosphatase [Clostridium caldaquaticum]